MNAGSFAPALVLNADFRPLNYFPLSLWSWQDAIKAVCLERVTIISEYEQSISSPTTVINLPSVIALKEYVPQNRNPAFTRFNVFLRDRFSCQYCGNGFSASDLTFDHVVPRSKGGERTGQMSWRRAARVTCAKATSCQASVICIRCCGHQRLICGSYRKMAVPSRRIICMNRGAIIFIGIVNCKATIKSRWSRIKAVICRDSGL